MCKPTSPKPATPSTEKYNNKLIRFLDKDDHYELIFTDDFSVPYSASTSSNDSVMTDIVTDLRDADKSKELHIFVASYGGDVHCLNMILQYISQFKYTIGINLGYACSCGFMILAFCNEIYTTPYATFLYHQMSSLNFGKVTEFKNYTEFLHNWWNILLEKSYIKKILTPEELKLGETTEVWLTGQELIDRNIANDYNMYAKRSIPQPINNEFFQAGDDIYRKEGNSYVRYVKDTKSKRSKLNYCQLLMQ